MNQTSFRGQQFTREDVERAMERLDRGPGDSFRRWRTYAVIMGAIIRQRNFFG
jgi:hypothetical protein